MLSASHGWGMHIAYSLSWKCRTSKVSLSLPGLRAPNFWGLAASPPSPRTFFTVSRTGQADNPQKPGALKPGNDSNTFETRYFQERLYLSTYSATPASYLRINIFSSNDFPQLFELRISKHTHATTRPILGTRKIIPENYHSIAYTNHILEEPI